MRSSPIPLYPPKGLSTGWARRAVWEGRAQMTAGKLTRADLKKNKNGKIVSKRASKRAKQSYRKNGLAMYQM